MSAKGTALATLRQFQSETDEIREAADPVAARITIWSLAAVLALCLVLSFVLTLDRVVASTAGKIVASESISVFQALDASLIKTFNVKEGQEVAKGQLLATLDQTFATADVDQLKQQIASLDAQLLRAEAEVSGVQPDFAGLREPDSARYTALQRALYDQRRAQYVAQTNSFDAKVSQINATITKLGADQARYKERERISQQIEGMRQTLLEKQAGSLLNLLISPDQRLELMRVTENGYNSLIEARQTLVATIADRDAFQQQWLAAVSQEIVAARNQRDAAVAQLSKAAKHQALVSLVAPEASVVLTLAKLSVGSVLKPGDPFITLMPLRVPVEAEINIASRDVGFVRAGDPVALKIDAFDFIQHGMARGTLTWVSEDAFTTDESGKIGEAFYKARVRIDAANLVNAPAHFRLIPGMTLTADINVGVRTVADYILGGVMRGYSEAMRER